MNIQQPSTNSQQPTDELYEHYRFEVTAGTEMLRIDKYLFNLIANTSRNKVQQAAKADCILVNGKPVRQNYKVRPGDTISVLMPNPPNDTEILPEHIPLNIVYEDKDLLIVNKEPGMVVHPAYGNYTGTLVNALYDYFQGQTLEDGSPVKPLLVHRIDKNTSGLLVVTKNELAQMRLAKTFFDHNLERKYWALVWGSFDEDAGTIVGNVGRNPKDRMVMTVFPEGSDQGKHAVTHWRVVERFGYVTLVECQLETGRTHQIRVHMQHIGHPLFNDEAYGGNRILKGTTFTKYQQFIRNCFALMPRQALHAKSLGFKHPITGKEILFESELPEDFAAVVEKWRGYSKNETL
jgi:23S rRNA pseudouridine1911/1915/1917 synthase